MTVRIRRRVDVAAGVVAVLVVSTSIAATGSGQAHGDAADAPAHTHAGEVASGPVGTIDTTVPAVFWDTPEIVCTGPQDPGSVSAPASCDDVPPLQWSVEVAGDADALRVDWDQPYRQDDMALTVTSPSGETFSQSSHNTYSEGIVVPVPDTGIWTIEVVPIRTDGTRLRLRAGLVDETALPEGSLLPNLRVTPPFEFGFAAPVSPLNPVFLAGDDQNPPAAVGGQATHSCAVDEVQEAADPTRQDEPTVLTRCLRLTTGPHNVGAGHFDLRFPIVDRAAGDRDRLVEMTQLIHNEDGSVIERDAGTYEYHVTHGHYHYLDILTYEAFRVVDPATGELEATGHGNKSGFCPADQGYGEWSTFRQSRQGAVGAEQGGANCFATSGNGAMGLSAGWGDFYRWQRSGQYIDFSGQGDGTYVVRATVDILDNVLESDETDNASYALIEVAGDEVTVLERGRGMDPWDPAKVVATDHRA